MGFEGIMFRGSNGTEDHEDLVGVGMGFKGISWGFIRGYGISWGLSQVFSGFHGLFVDACLVEMVAVGVGAKELLRGSCPHDSN
jgi:hypothetical protein